MPTYEYRCAKCGAEFVRVMSLSEYGGTKIFCPKCNSPDVKQQMTGFVAQTSRKS
jgi:putative FmdB family regulatory protein